MDPVVWAGTHSANFDSFSVDLILTCAGVSEPALSRRYCTTGLAGCSRQAVAVFLLLGRLRFL
jgi:hypothetical protein